MPWIVETAATITEEMAQRAPDLARELGLKTDKEEGLWGALGELGVRRRGRRAELSHAPQQPTDLPLFETASTAEENFQEPAALESAQDVDRAMHEMKEDMQRLRERRVPEREAQEFSAERRRRFR